LANDGPRTPSREWTRYSVRSALRGDAHRLGRRSARHLLAHRNYHWCVPAAHLPTSTHHHVFPSKRHRDGRVMKIIVTTALSCVRTSATARLNTAPMSSALVLSLRSNRSFRLHGPRIACNFLFRSRIRAHALLHRQLISTVWTRIALVPIRSTAPRGKHPAETIDEGRYRRSSDNSWLGRALFQASSFRRFYHVNQRHRGEPPAHLMRSTAARSRLYLDEGHLTRISSPPTDRHYTPDEQIAGIADADSLGRVRIVRALSRHDSANSNSRSAPRWSARWSGPASGSK